MDRYHPRLVDRLLGELLASFPAVMLVGPRACGKTTTASRQATTIVRLDRAVEAGPFRDDPDTVLAQLDPPVLLDEWQLVPEVLGSVKRAVDTSPGRGRFILTGSARAELLEPSWAATGRVLRVGMWGLSERELVGSLNAPSFFDVAFGGELASLRASPEPLTLVDYVATALRGGFPDVAFEPSATNRRRWLDSYIDQMVVRDADLADESRDPVKLRRYLTALASNTAGVVEHKVLYDAAGITHVTASAYDSLLELLFVTERLPAWHSNRLKRLTRAPKRYVAEPALLGPLLGLDSSSVIRSADLLGRVIDTFVLNQLRPELEVAETRPRLAHLRLDAGRRECDLVAEAPDGRVIAFEIKSAAAPRPTDARHLAWLRDQLGTAFVAGVVFHTGPRVFSLGDKLQALPISAIWTPP